MFTRTFLFASLFFMVLFQSYPVSAKTLYTLNDLAQLAHKHSQTIKIAEDDLYIAQEDKKRAFSVLVPRATLFGSLTERKNEDFSSPDTSTLGGKLTQSFTLNGRELIALGITKETIKSRTFSLESIKAQYMLAVAQAYYDILSAQRSLEIAQADVERLNTYRDSVRERLNVGNVTKTDLYRAEAELSRSLTNQVVAENTILKNKAILRNLVDVDDDYELEKDPSPFIENYLTTVDEVKDEALAKRTEIKEAEKNLRIAQKTIDLNKSDYWPTVSLEAGYRETDIEYSSGTSPVEYDTEDLYLQGEISFTLFDGGLRKATINQAIADQRKAQNNLELRKKEVVLESRNAYYDYESAKRTIVNLKDELRAAQETFNAVQMQLEYGMADSLDAMDANSLLVSAQRGLSDAEYSYYFSVLRILYTKGELLNFLSPR